MPIYHGKAHDIDLLDALNAYQAKGVILTMKDISRYTNIIERIAISFPNLFIETRCYDSKDAEKHINLGASCSFPDQSGVAIQMCNRMIQHISDSNKVDN
jgi:voltage-gated potassium channel Kch